VDYYTGIDLSLEQSSRCILDAGGQIVRKTKVSSEPDALTRFFRQQLDPAITQLGLEAGPLSHRLHAALSTAGLSPALLEIGTLRRHSRRWW